MKGGFWTLFNNIQPQKSGDVSKREEVGEGGNGDEGTAIRKVLGNNYKFAIESGMYQQARNGHSAIPLLIQLVLDAYWSRD